MCRRVGNCSPRFFSLLPLSGQGVFVCSNFSTTIRRSLIGGAVTCVVSLSLLGALTRMRDGHNCF